MEVQKMKLFLLLSITFLFSCNPERVMAQSERYHQDKWCKQHNGITEYRVKGGRVDCLTREYAIEFGFANKWKEDITQARWYALQTGKKPMIATILKKPSDIKYVRYIEQYQAAYGACLTPIKVIVLTDY